jgi:ADP-heptose:LPS heptosyltransferase
MESARLARTMSELGPVDLSNLDSWSLKLGDDEFKSANKLLGGFKKHNYFAINFGGKAEEKDWGADNWIALISELSVKYHNCGLIILGSSAESDRAKELLNIWPYGGVNLCGVSSPRESACILANAIFFIGHDSGPLHLAASLQIPCIGLFGNYNSPIKWHPYGSRVSVLHEMRGINWITVEDVCYALEALLCLDIQ